MRRHNNQQTMISTEGQEMPGGSASEAPPEPKHGCDGNHGVQLFPLSNLFFFPYLVMDVDLSKIPNYSKIRAKD